MDNCQIHFRRVMMGTPRKYLYSQKIFPPKPLLLPVLQVEVWLAIPGAIFKDPEAGNVPRGGDQHLQRDGRGHVHLHSGCFVDCPLALGPQGTTQVFLGF